MEREEKCHPSWTGYEHSLVGERPARGRCYRIDEWGGDLRLGSMAIPTPGPGEALLRTAACGVGLTVVNGVRGDFAEPSTPLPRIPGHEVVGRIIETGPGVPSDIEGRLAAAYFYLICGRCPACIAGRENHCANLAGFLGTHRDGGYADYVLLPVANIVTIPETLDPVMATVVPDAVATPVHVSRRAGIGPTDTVAVIGAGGGLGIHMLQVAQVFGATVIGIDRGSAKLEAIEELGFVAVDASETTDPGRSPWLVRRPPNVIVDFVGSADTQKWAVESLRGSPSSRMVVLTTFRQPPFAVSARDLVYHESAIIGSRYATRDEVGIAAQLVDSGRVKAVIGQQVGFEDVAQLHVALETGALVGRGAMTTSAHGDDVR